jgi:RNA polymerase sigma factor (sigma-70 family)
LEASALRHPGRRPALVGRSPHLRLQSDERLVALVRRGHDVAFEALVRRYYPRLLAFCRHMLGSLEDAEDALQEVLSSAYTAIRADERTIAVRPWLYRIARNRCLTQLQRPRPTLAELPEDGEAGVPTPAASETLDRREELRAMIADVQRLPESQRAALLLRQIDSLSYEQIAATLDTSVAGVKSLLVRARISLAEASEARRLTCSEVRLELGHAAEGVVRASAPARRHARECPRCRRFKRELRRTSRGLAALVPAAPLLPIQHLLAGKLGGGSAAAAGGSSLAGSGGALAGSGGAALSAGAGSLVAKAAVGLLAAGAVTVGAVEARRTTAEPPPGPAQTADVRHADGPAADLGSRRPGAGGGGDSSGPGQEAHGAGTADRVSSGPGAPARSRALSAATPRGAAPPAAPGREAPADGFGPEPAAVNDEPTDHASAPDAGGQAEPTATPDEGETPPAAPGAHDEPARTEQDGEEAPGPSDDGAAHDETRPGSGH